VYNESVSAALNPEGMEQAFVLFEHLGWPVAACVFVPLAGMLVYGFILGEQRRETFWLLVITGFLLGIFSVIGFAVYWLRF